jgi:hypothetical protein
MVKFMNLTKAIKSQNNNKKGSYIIECSLTLPVLILCICSLVLLIRIIGVCENICFTTSEEMLKIDLNSYKIYNRISLCRDLENKLNEENVSSFKVKNFKYLFSSGEMTDLIAMDGEAKFSVKNPIGINTGIDFEVKLLTRGFTGALQHGDNLSEEDFLKDGASYEVAIFPKYGLRYHKLSCRYVKQHDDEKTSKIIIEGEDAKRRGYTPCKVCIGAANVQ